MSDDRTVHARYRDMEIVRYDRAGKWYLEPTIPGLPRQHVGVKAAAQSAYFGVTQGDHGQVFLGLPGGTTFDREFLRIQSRHSFASTALLSRG